MTDLVMGLIIGFVVGSFLLSGLLYVAIKRVRSLQAARLATQEETIVDLRQELAEDKETNRHLRHQIHSLTVGSDAAAPASVGAASVMHAVDIDTALSERDSARHELAETQRSLESVRARLADREDKLREYREAVKEIRLSLESQDRLRDLISITQDVPANAQVESS
ncbi:MAG: hypothetical protein OEW83_17650 [Acidimicrobiia bacterium]|nr:hypothetical protein [Acidimicrobiia bacterium]